VKAFVVSLALGEHGVSLALGVLRRPASPHPLGLGQTGEAGLDEPPS